VALYSDLLLHHMGSELADQVVLEGSAGRVPLRRPYGTGWICQLHDLVGQFTSIWCSKRSEYSATVFSPSAGVRRSPRLQFRCVTQRASNLAEELAAVRVELVSDTAAGAARKRMKCATLVTLLCASTRRRPIKPLRSSGVAFSKQELGGLPRSSGKISLVTPAPPGMLRLRIDPTIWFALSIRIA